MEIKKYKLSEICEISSGKTPPTQERKYWENGTIPWYTQTEISNQTLTPKKFITEEAFKGLPLTTKNSIFLCNVSEAIAFYPSTPGLAYNQQVFLLEPKIDKVIPNYLYYLLCQQKKNLNFLMQGTIFKSLTKTELKNLSLSLPPLSQQKQILTKFQLVYNKIHKTEIVYNDTLLKIIQKHLEIGDLLFLKHKDSEIKVGDEFKLVAGKTPSTINYPLQKKNIPLEVVRNFPHLRAKTNYFLALFRLRHSISKAIHDFFHQEGFYYVPTPIITNSDTEGAGELFNITTNEKEPFFSKSAKLTVSGQLQAEALAQGLGKVYTFSPCFRAEKSHTTRHLAEFWMVELEMTFTDLERIINLAEKMIKQVINCVLDNNIKELEFLGNYNQKELVNKLKKVVGANFKKVEYSKCIEILEKKKNLFIFNDIKWGMDLQSEHEKYLCQYFDNSPVFILNYPIELKAFYMKNNTDGKTVAGFDLLLPEIGELIGGSVREDNYQILKEKAQKIGLDINNLSWYFDLRKYGYAPSGGFGLGLERLIMWISGTENIRDTIAFPRYPKHLEF